MWPTRKKERDPNSVPIISSPIGPPVSIEFLTNSDFAVPFGRNENKKDLKLPKDEKSKAEKGSGIKKRILQLGARVHGHGFGTSNSMNPDRGNLTAKELSQLEETRSRLFSPTPPPLNILPDGGQSTSTNSQFSPAMSSASATTAPDFSFDMPKEFNVPGLNLPALANVQMYVRQLTLQKNVSGDYGFNIRRIQYPMCGEQLNSIVFAEPHQVRHGPPRPGDLTTSLMPGDQLLEVNGKSVGDMSRDDLQREIEQSGNEIHIKVRARPELTDFFRHNASNNFANEDDSLQINALQEITSTGENIPEECRYWLIHSRGFTICRLLERLANGKIRISIGDVETIVDTSDVDRANPTSLDRVSDVALLKYLNETSAIHLFRQRYGCNLRYTSGGSQNLICLLPSRVESEEPAEGNDINLVKMFHGCRRGQMPAHIYAMAQQVHRNLQTSNRNQTVIFTGVSGSGKSFQLRNFLYYFCNGISGGRSKSLSFDILNSALDVFECLGSCKSRSNAKSSRFVNLISLTFDTSAILCAAKMQTFLLETSRLLPNAGKQSTFNIFYDIWEGSDFDLRSRLGFDLIKEPFIYKHAKSMDNVSYKTKWSHFLRSLSVLGFSSTTIDGIIDVLAAIFHLNFAGATQGAAAKSSFIRIENAEFASKLLGINLEQLVQIVFFNSTSADDSSSTILNFQSKMNKNMLNRFSMSNRIITGQQSLNSFIQVLYNELFMAIGILINKCICSKEGISSAQINILDAPGGNFHSPSESKLTSFLTPNSLSDLTFNYVNERIHELIYTYNFCDQAELYSREQVDVTIEKPLATPVPLTRLLDKKQQLLNCVDLDRRSAELRGLFYILEEESMFPGATNDSFFERIFIHFEQNRLIRRHPKNRLQFILGHCLNTLPTVYSVDGWLEHAQPSSEAFVAVPRLLQASKKTSISDLFTITGLSHSTSTTHKLRRSTQAVQFSETGKALGGFFSNISAQIEYFLSSISRQSRLHFVHCLRPKHQTNLNDGSMATDYACPDVLDVSYIRQQIRPILFIDSVRSSSRGYPERMAFRDFRRRFQCLVDGNQQGNFVGSDMNTDLSIDVSFDDRSYAQKILERMEIYEHRYRLGLSQILLRNDVLLELEEKRDLSLSGLIIDFQYQCRKYLARKWLSKRRVQEIAIKCIQRNSRFHLQIRNWPWWNLYMKILPLLSVAKVDQEQREWRERVEALELANAELKLSKLKLEGEMAELEQHLKSECHIVQSASLSLEQESQARLRLEGEIRRLQQQLQLQRKGEEIAGENQSTNKTESDNHKKNTELNSEMAKLKEQESSLKLKNQKTTEQLLDLQAEVENLRSRNEQLEKRQKDFNGEMKLVREQLIDLGAQKAQLEKQCNETESLIKDRGAEIQTLKIENTELRTNLKKTRRELDEVLEANCSAAGDSKEAELLALRKAKRDLEAKLVEVENELEDTVIRNQTLEQKQTRLEMSTERLRADLQRESDSKETEISEIRAQYQRRLRTFEDQINELSDANSSLLKQNRILESRARQLDSQSQASSVDLGNSSLYYKRELRKALAMLRDTQSVLAHERESSSNHSIVRQLKEQLEDAETAKLAALRSRHSLENELSDLRNQLDMVNVAKTTAEDKVLAIMRDKNSANNLAQEHDEQLQELLKKYKAQIQQSHVNSITLADQVEQISELERAKHHLQEQLSEAAVAIEFNKLHTVEKHKMQLLELKLRDVQAKLDLETSQKLRFESIIAKLKEEIECLQEQLLEAKSAKDREFENVRKVKKECQILQEQLNELKKRETELLHRYKTVKLSNEQHSEENQKTLSDLKLALKRIDALQAALNADLTAGSDIEEEDENDFDNDTSAKLLDDEDNTTSSLTDGESGGRKSVLNGGSHSVC